MITKISKTEIKISLLKTLSLLILAKLRPKSLKKTNIIKNHQSYLATKVNAIKIIKEDKNKVKNLSYIEYYTCKQKSYYTN